MRGRGVSEFIDELYSNPEMEIEYNGVLYSINGYLDDNKEYILRVDSIETQSKEVFFAKSKTVRDCVKAFEKAKLFDEKTIYEAESEITVLYG